MDDNEKQYILLKWGLALKLIIDKNRLLEQSRKEQGKKDRNIINSFGRLAAASGITKATLVNISLGGKNAASSTWAAILEALEMSMTDFGQVFDSIRETDVLLYKEEIESAREERAHARLIRRKRADR